MIRNHVFANRLVMILTFSILCSFFLIMPIDFLINNPEEDPSFHDNDITNSDESITHKPSMVNLIDSDELLKTRARALTINYNPQKIELEPDKNITGLTFQLLKNSTVLEASFNVTGLPSYDYSLWDRVSVITDHNFDGESKAPAIAQDSTETTHVVWMEEGRIGSQDLNWDIILGKESDSTWQPFTLISTQGTANNDHSRWPDIFIDNTDNIHIVWVDETEIDNNDNDMDIFYRRIWGNNPGMSNPKVISKEVGFGKSTNPVVAVNESGDIFVVW